MSTANAVESSEKSINYPRIIELINRLGTGKLQAKTGISGTQLRRYRNGGEPTANKLELLARAGGVSTDYLLGMSDEMWPTFPASELLSDQYISDILNADPECCELVSVQGDSMQPLLRQGDKVLVNRSVNRGDGLFALKIAGQIQIKRLQTMPDGSCKATSENPQYEPIVIAEDSPVEIFGRVIWRAGRI